TGGDAAKAPYDLLDAGVDGLAPSAAGLGRTPVGLHGLQPADRLTRAVSGKDGCWEGRAAGALGGSRRSRAQLGGQGRGRLEVSPERLRDRMGAQAEPEPL